MKLGGLLKMGIKTYSTIINTSRLLFITNILTELPHFNLNKNQS